MDNETCCRFPEWGREVVRTFFLPSLNLFYDYTTGDSFEHRFDHLPKPEEIAAEDPDPCGRGSGMEDCPLHAGAMLDAAIRCGESELASRVLIGLESLVMRHGRPGFVARGFSPFAGNLCYPNSSRDQFTLAVFGAWRAFCSMPSAVDRRCAAEILRNISDYCLENVTAENDFNLGRFDGGPAMVSLMRRGCAPHEALRLPMFHAAAGVATGESERIAVAAALLPEAIAKTLEMRDDGGWWDISLSQFQLSVAVLLECNAFPEAAGTLREISRRFAVSPGGSLRSCSPGGSRSCPAQCADVRLARLSAASAGRRSGGRGRPILSACKQRLDFEIIVDSTDLHRSVGLGRELRGGLVYFAEDSVGIFIQPITVRTVIVLLFRCLRILK